MNTESPRARTVRVLIHTTKAGLLAIGIVASEWQGAVRVDRRLARLRPVPEPHAAPPGVDRDIWLAWCGLLEEIERTRTDGVPPPR